MVLFVFVRKWVFFRHSEVGSFLEGSELSSLFFSFMLLFLLFVNPTETRAICEYKVFLPGWLMASSWLQIIWEGWAYCDWCQPWPGVLSEVRQRAEQATGGQPVGIVSPCSLLQVLTPRCCLRGLSWFPIPNKLRCSCICLWRFTTVTENKVSKRLRKQRLTIKPF